MTTYIMAEKVFEGEEEYLTAGKWYEVLREDAYRTNTAFGIIDDNGGYVYTLQSGSSHLPDGVVWQRVERDEEPEQ